MASGADVHQIRMSLCEDGMEGHGEGVHAVGHLLGAGGLAHVMPDAKRGNKDFRCYRF